ncbi:MAG: repair protein RecN [Clostridiales bacterium]|nr:repair protein RecN [Clostridiales bacterium]
MLKELIIENLVLIDYAHIAFDRGLNILTGETGAGKSVIIDAIALLLGERADKDAIRSGCDKGRIEGLFDITGYTEVKDLLDLYGIDLSDDEYLILSRELNASGKNVCRINGAAVPLSMLKDISSRLINLHSQASHYALLDTQNHGLFLDRFAGVEVEELKAEISKYYNKWQKLNAELSKWSADPQIRQREMDLLSYQINEIEAARLRPGEDAELEQQRTIYNNYQRIMDVLLEAYTSLYNGEEERPPLIDVLGDLQKGLKGISDIDPKLAKISDDIDSIIYDVEELISSVSNYMDTMEYNPAQADEIEERLNTINNLKRKYGDTIEDISAYKNKLIEKLEIYQNSQQYIQNLEEDKCETERELYSICSVLSEKRKMAAAQLESQVMAELKDIAMENAIFKVSIISPENMEDARYTQNGFDDISFLMTSNPGEPLRPLAKVASGGEMSRIMLALNAVLGHIDRVPTMIFDEIDAGISGKTAHKVAQKLARISREHQLICVTHLAQIASMADAHYLIKKENKGQRTYTRTYLLDPNQRLKEIARLLGGIELSSASMSYAREMMDTSAAFKANTAAS